MATDILWTGTTSGDASVSTNYSPAQVPITGDSLWFRDNAVDVDAGLAALTAVKLVDMHVEQSYTGKLGTTSAYFQIGFNNLYIGEHYGSGTPSGSGRIKIHLSDITSGACKIIVVNSASTGYDSNLPPVRIKSSYAAMLMYINKGKVGLGLESPGEACTLDELYMAYVDNRDSDAQVTIESGVTMDKLIKTGGEATVLCDLDDLTNHAGEAITAGAAVILAMNIEGGLVISNASGTVTAANVNGGTLDLTKSMVARTVNTINRGQGGKVKFDPNYVSVTNFNSSGPMEWRAA